MDGRKGFVFSWNKKHRPIHEEALKHFFDPSKNSEKFEYQLSANPDPPSQARRVTPAETIPTKAEENKCSSDIGKITQEKGTFFVISRCSIVFFPDKRIDRDQYVFVRWKFPCQCIYGFLLNICLLWFNFILGLNFITLFRGIEMYDNEFKTKGN